MAKIRLRVEEADAELLEELESFLRRKLKVELSRSANVFSFPEDVRRSVVVDVVRWFRSKKSRETGMETILHEDQIVLKRTKK